VELQGVLFYKKENAVLGEFSAPRWDRKSGLPDHSFFRPTVGHADSFSSEIISKEWCIDGWRWMLGIVLGMLEGNRMTSEMGMRKTE
jgi:hypothetical protein